MTTATDTLRDALDRHDRGVPDKSTGEHEAPNSATGSLREDDDRQLIARVSTWLFGIARHAGLKALARSAKESGTPLPLGEEGDHEEPESTHDPATTVLGWELGRELMAALRQLSPGHRAVIELTLSRVLSTRRSGASWVARKIR